MKHLYLNPQKAIIAVSFISLFTAKSYGQCTPPPAPVAPGTIVCSGSSANLTATGSGPNYQWFANSTGTLLASTQSYSTAAITSNTTFYVAQYATSNSGSLNIPAQTSTFSGNSRGFFFIAPTSMTLTGVRVPTDAGTGNYNIAIVKFPVVPPVYSAVTNTFTSLYLAQNQPGTSTVTVNIPIAYGDIIGVLGDRGGICSYASGSPFTNVSFGTHSVTLGRLGMQFPLASTIPQDLWQEATGSISRVELYANLACMSPLAASAVTVSTCTGIEEFYGDDFKLSPNPALNSLNIKVGNELAGAAFIELYDAFGKSVMKQSISEKEMQLNIGALESGIYIYKVYTSNRVVRTDKLIKY